MRKILGRFATNWMSVLALGVAFAGCADDDDDKEQWDVILEWNAVALEANLIDHSGPDLPGDQLSSTQGPPASARVLAIVHAAMFDAYNSVDRRFTPYLVQVDGPAGASAAAAVAQAAHDVLSALIPAGDAVYQQALASTLERVDDPSSRQAGRDMGASVAQQILAARAGDAPFLAGMYAPTGAPGNHDVDPENPNQSFISPNIGGLPPFGVSDVVPFRAPPPPSLDSAQYTAAFDEVRQLGAFRGGETGEVPTDDVTYVIANFWSYNGSPGTGTPPRLYNQIARVIAVEQGNSVHQNARLFALINIAMADGGISAWDTKYEYAYWRPILGIRQADDDNNPLTEADPTWRPLGGSRSNPLPGESNFSPPFPAYTSGHATFGAAAFKMLANFYQRDLVAFSFLSDEWNGVTVDQFGRTRPTITRSYDRLSQAAAENAASRVFNGVHWRFDGSEGVRAGNAIADAIFDTLLRPLDGQGGTAIPDVDFEAQIDQLLTDI